MTELKKETCSLCKQEAVDSLEFEAGNNAEIPVTIEVCETHWQEYDKDEWAFRDKYGERIDGLAYEHLIDCADSKRGE